MRWFFDYEFDGLKLKTSASLFDAVFNQNGPLIALPNINIVTAAPTNPLLYADIDGDTGDNTLVGTSGDDTINGFAGNDTLDGLGGTNTLIGGTGADVFIISLRGEHETTITDFEDGVDLIDVSGLGISSFDQLRPAVPLGVLYEQRANVLLSTIWDGLYGRLTIENISLADLSAADFVFDMTTDSQTILGADERGTLFGGLGDDIIIGGSGSENIFGGDGDDYIDAGLGFYNRVYGGEGVDSFAVTQRGQHETQIYDFELGIETIDVSILGATSIDQVLDFTGPYGAGVRFYTVWDGSLEQLHIRNVAVSDLSAADFVLDTNTASRTLMGSATLSGTLFGSPNDDIIIGDSSTRQIHGGHGDDYIETNGVGVIFGGTGVDTFVLTDFRDSARFADFEDGVEVIDLSGTDVSSFDQMMTFVSGNNSAFGFRYFWDGGYRGFSIADIDIADISAADFIFNTDPTSRNITGPNHPATLFGGVGDDVIMGTGWPDYIHGGNGDDYIDPGLGSRNQVWGGQGADSFAITQRARFTGYSTTVWDFEDGVDRMDFSGIGVSSFDQITPYLSQIGADVVFRTLWNFESENLYIENTNLADLTAADFIFDMTTNGVTITGNNSENVYFGSLGDDIITAGDRDDEINAGDGNDMLDGGGFADILRGGNGDDTLFGGAGNDINDGGAGIDLLSYINSASSVNVNLGAGTASGGHALGDTNFNIENLDGSNFNDALTGNDDNNVINGGLGADRLTGGEGDDILNGGDGSDTLMGGLGADALNGGAGFDAADYRDALAGVAFNVLTGGTGGEALGDTYSSIERYFLSNFSDVVTGSDANEFFYGEDGNDQINGGGGIDRIYGGNGDDIQRGQDGNDTLYSSAGADQLNGGAGFDIARYDNALAAVSVNMLTGGTGGDAAGDTYFGIEAVYGSDFDDNLTGNNSANELRGGDGNDMLFGLGGNDRFFGSAGADSFDGGTGIDIVNYTLAAAGVTLDLTTSGSVGEAAGDSYTSIEWVFGSDFDDSITGNSANNRLEGRDGNDTLNGEGGNDRLLGGDGNDIINGGDGVDTIFGQDGNDIMSGGAGNDFFFGGAGADSHDGGAGTDSVSYLASGPIAIQNGIGVGGDAAGDTYMDIERYFGSSGDDIINASGVLLGNGGNDYLLGMNRSNDSLNGGAGIDTFGYDTSGGGADVIQGFFLGEQISILGEDPNFDTQAEILAVGTDVGANVIFDFGGGNTLTIVGVNLADLPNNTFTFEGPLFGEPLNDSDAFAGGIINSFDIEALI